MAALMPLSRRAWWLAAPLLAIVVFAVLLPFIWRNAGLLGQCALGQDCAAAELLPAAASSSNTVLPQRWPACVLLTMP
ncbi:hypothetical protein ACVBEH_28240, partial [Roseateles sp. GG27B]